MVTYMGGRQEGQLQPPFPSTTMPGEQLQEAETFSYAMHGSDKLGRGRGSRTVLRSRPKNVSNQNVSTGRLDSAEAAHSVLSGSCSG
jgi:hypothetical protein